MIPFSMDTGSDSNSSGSASAAGTEKEEESHQRGNKGRKRRQKNRDAARKSRRKQTERADDLHKELQRLERSNTALENEIAALTKDLRLYTSALEGHEPLCHLRIDSASPPARLSSCSSPAAAPLPADCGNGSSAARAHLQTSCSSTSVTSCQRECIHLPTTTTSNSPTRTSSSLTISPASFCAAPSLYSLFAPVCTSLVSNPVPSTFLDTPPLPHSSALTNDLDYVFYSSSRDPPSSLYSATLDALLLKQVSFSPSSLHPTPTIVPASSPQLHTGQFSGAAADSNSLCAVSPYFHDCPAVQSLSISPPTNQGACAAPDLAIKPTYCQQNAPRPSSPLSLLNVPSPIDPPQNTSSTFTGPLYQPSRDFSLSELLEGNAWILDGSANH